MNRQIMEKIIPSAKALYIDKNTLYIARGYSIYKSSDNTEHWTLDGRIEDFKYAFLGRFSRLLNRLLRIEVSNMLVLDDGTRILSAKKGIFVAKPGSQKYIKTFDIIRGNKPMNICLDNDGSLYFGEYFLNGKFVDTQREEVHIYRSEDRGQSWKICYTFPKNTVRHIHGIFYDSYTNRLWVTTGDRDNECMIAYTSDKFKSLEIVKTGSQKYRAVTLLFYNDYIIYGTDTEHEKNYIYSFLRDSDDDDCLQELQGSVLTATQSGNMAALSTAVEPSKVNNYAYVHIWLSENGLEWKDIYSAKKDKWSYKYFQYGRITFPQYAIRKNKLFFNGHALENIDNKTILYSFK